MTDLSDNVGGVTNNEVDDETATSYGEEHKSKEVTFLLHGRATKLKDVNEPRHEDSLTRISSS